MASASESGDLTVLSWNINGLKEIFKKKERKTALLEIFEQYDVVLLQETHIGERKDDKADDKDWKIITDAFEKYALVKLEDQTRRETADNQEEEEKKEEEKKEGIEEEKTMYMPFFNSCSKGVGILVNKPHILLKAFSEGGDYQEEETEEETRRRRRMRRRRETKEEKKKEETTKEEKEGEGGEEGGSRRRRRRRRRRRGELRRETMYMTSFSSSSKGVGILVNKPHTLLKAFSEDGYYAWVHVEIDQQKYMFVSVYYHRDYPHLICNLMLEIIYSFLTEGSDAFTCRLVIGGDFNTTLDPKLDATTDDPKHTARRKTLNEFLRIMKLSDVWRKMHHKDRKYTHTYTYTNKDKEVKTTQSRLDYVFMLKDDVKYVKSCDILDDIDLSDHSRVSLTLNYTNDRRA